MEWAIIGDIPRGEKKEWEGEGRGIDNSLSKVEKQTGHSPHSATVPATSPCRSSPQFVDLLLLSTLSTSSTSHVDPSPLDLSVYEFLGTRQKRSCIPAPQPRTRYEILLQVGPHLDLALPVSDHLKEGRQVLGSYLLAWCKIF